MSSEDRNISKRFYQIIFGMFVLTGVLNGMAWMFPTAFLLLLGEKYNGLDILLRWSLATATLGTLNQVASHLMNSRGLIMPPLAFILFSIIVQILALWSQDLTRLEGVFLAAIIPAASTFILRLTYFFVRFKDLARNS